MSTTSTQQTLSSDGLDVLVDRADNPMLNDTNALKLAVFCANVARGTSISTAETLPKGQWQETRRLALAADAAGLDGFIPLGRWKANTRTQRPEDDRWMEVLTMAAAVGAITEHIAVFSTVHMPIIHPVIMAAMTSTIDHVTGGRFVINVTAGFNQPEMDMFGLKLLPHDERYEYAREWIELLKKVWTSEDIFDWDGKYFHGKTIINKPLPLQRPYPVIMSAGSSGAGRAFAAQHADLNFVHLPSWEEMAEAVSTAKTEAAEKHGRQPGILAGGYVVCADTEKEAWRRYHYVTREKMDVETARLFTQEFNSQSESQLVVEMNERTDRMASGFNAMPLVGTAEQIVERMQKMSEAGLAGLAISFDDYDEGIASYDEVLRPLLIDAGLRSR